MTGLSEDNAPVRSAAEWFIVMRGPGAEDARAAFAAWHAVPENAAAYARLEATWDESLFLANRPVGRMRDLSRARKSASPAMLLAAGIGALAIVSGGLFVERLGWFGPTAVQQPETRDLAAGESVRTVRLSDGSRVTLDRHSLLRDLGSARDRHFLLLRGRARFEVAHDAARPFIVDAGGSRVVAHGTVFDVGFEGAAVRVALLQGSVEVRERGKEASAPASSRFLRPGEQLVARRGEASAPSPASPASLSWPGAMISFDDMPLGEAIAAFNLTGNPAVRIEDEALATQRLSGAFRRDDARGFADALAATFGFVVRTGADGSLILAGAGSGPG